LSGLPRFARLMAEPRRVEFRPSPWWARPMPRACRRFIRLA